MPDAITINAFDGISPDLQRKAAALQDRRALMGVLGKKLEVELRDHFRDRNSEPNKMGWPAQNFWNRIRNATALTAFDNDTATVTVADPAFNQKLHGGTIVPKEAKALAIPMDPEAYGKSPREFNNLHLVVTPERAMLVTNLASNLTKQRGGGFKSRSSQISRVMFLLVKSVEQSADPRALPDEARLQRELGATADDWLRRNAGAS
jgi:hypothetical protein